MGKRPLLRLFSTWSDRAFRGLQCHLIVTAGGGTALIPDRSSIFNVNFIQLLSQFLPTGQEMLNPDSRPVLRLKGAQ